jgi:hypothetical protein
MGWIGGAFVSIGHLKSEGDLERFLQRRDQKVKNENVKISKLRADVDSLVLSGGDKHYVHTQSIPAATWTINHNLGKRPSVTIVDSAGTEWVTEVEHTSDNQCVARFENAFSGKAYAN